VPKVAQIHEDFPRTGTGKARSASYAPNCATFSLERKAADDDNTVKP